MSQSTNLALRPFRNERFPWLLASLLLIGSAFVSLLHARFISRLLSGTEAKTVQLVRDDEARAAQLETLVAEEPPARVETSDLARLRAFKEIVDLRVFPWRRLLKDLEDLLSEDVRLVRIAPASSKNLSEMRLELSGEARTKDAAFSFAEALEASPEFSQAVLKSLDEEERIVKFTVEAVFDGVARTTDAAHETTTRAGIPKAPASPAAVEGRKP